MAKKVPITENYSYLRESIDFLKSRQSANKPPTLYPAENKTNQESSIKKSGKTKE